MYRLARKVRTVVLVAMTVVVMLFIPPFRNILILGRLPGLWKDVSTYQLLKAQWYSVSSDTAALSSCTLPAPSQHDPAQQLLHKASPRHPQPRPQDEESVRQALAWFNGSLQRRQRYGKFRPRLSPRDKARLLETWRVLHETLTRHNVSHFLTDGSLLGALRHGGIIPWDDDLDLGVHTADVERLRGVLSCVPGYTLRVQPNMHWKFFAEDADVVEVTAHAPVREVRVLEEGEKEGHVTDFHPEEDVVMRFPFIDVFLFTGDGSYLWPKPGWLIATNLFPVADVYPLARADFEGLPGGVPVPRNSARILRQAYQANTCVSAGHDHRQGKGITDIDAVPCKELADIYTVHTI